MTREEKLEEIIMEFGLDDDTSFVFIGDPSSTMYDGAIIGVTELYDNGCSEFVLVYDYEKMAQCQMEHDGVSYEEAVEWIDFNVLGSLVAPVIPGRMNPVILRPFLES